MMADVNIDRHKAKVANVVALLKRSIGDAEPQRILVVGAGDGSEAKIIAAGFAAKTTAIDLRSECGIGIHGNIEFLVMDARDMSFEDEEFDLVYSFHVLEHIMNDKVALAEMARVLRTGGTYLIGTPNKQRLVAYYLSAPSIRKAIIWNWADWKARLMGRFDNEHGAHAGYSLGQLKRRCEKAFGQALEITDDYYELNYPKHRTALKLLSLTELWRLVYPSVYVSGTKVRRD